MSSDDPRLTGLAPVLAVDDLNETVEYYRTVLGFDVDFTWGDPPYYAIARRGGDVSIHLSEREDTSEPIAPMYVYIFVTGVDQLYEEYAARGVEIFQPPQDMEYGMREFDACDLNGHFLTFGQNIE